GTEQAGPWPCDLRRRQRVLLFGKGRNRGIGGSQPQRLERERTLDVAKDLPAAQPQRTVVDPSGRGQRPALRSGPGPFVLLRPEGVSGESRCGDDGIGTSCRPST